ncbi:MAG: hypothetical protein AAF990_13480 [Bacteroidota bacterium]
MKSFRYYFLLFVAFCWYVQPSNGQVVIRPTSVNSPFFNLDQLLQFQLINTTNETIKGVVQIQVEDNYSNAVLQVSSLPMELTAGASVNHRQVQWEGGIRLEENQLARWLAQSGGLPNGQYIYCYRFLDAASGRTMGNFCQENASIEFRLPELIYPFDRAELQDLFPVLSWRPPIPLRGNALTYHLRLVALEEGQNPLLGINSNLPLVDKQHLRSLSFPYPPTAIPLQENIQYAWQITAFWEHIEVGRTDVWTFSIQPPKAADEPPPKEESYRLVKRKLEGRNYFFTDKIYFAYDNRAYDQKLDYQIYLKNDKSQKIDALPSFELSPGMNYLTLAVRKKMDLQRGAQYVLMIKDKYQRNHYLEFTYADENEN